MLQVTFLTRDSFFGVLGKCDKLLLALSFLSLRMEQLLSEKKNIHYIMLEVYPNILTEISISLIY
jgi:hypothetical protein